MEPKNTRKKHLEMQIRKGTTILVSKVLEEEVG